MPWKWSVTPSVLTPAGPVLTTGAVHRPARRHLQRPHLPQDLPSGPRRSLHWPGSDISASQAALRSAARGGLNLAECRGSGATGRRVGWPQRGRAAAGLRPVHLRTAARSQTPHRGSHPAQGRRLDDQASRPNLGTYWTQPPAFHGSRPHTAAHGQARERSTPDRIPAGQGLFPQVVAGVGFEPT